MSQEIGRKKKSCSSYEQVIINYVYYLPVWQSKQDFSTGRKTEEVIETLTRM